MNLKEAVKSVTGYDFNNENLLNAAFKIGDKNKNLASAGRFLFDFIVSDYTYNRHEDTFFELYALKLKEKFSAKDLLKCNKLEKFLTYENVGTEKKSFIEFGDKKADGEENAFFALIFAIYRDGGIPSVKSFLLPLFKRISSDGEFSALFTTSEDKKNELSPRIHPLSNQTAKNDFKNAGEKSAEKNTAVTESAESKTERKKDKKHSIFGIFPGKKKNEEIERSVKDKNVKRKSFEEFLSKNTEEGESEPIDPKKSPFIRDALKPVKLSELPSAKKNTQGAIEKQNKPSAENPKSVKKEDVVPNYEQIEFFKTENKNPQENSKNESVSENPDYISLLNQHYQRKERKSAVSLIYEKQNSEKKNVFKIAVIFGGEKIGEGTGTSLREAKREAAKNAFLSFAFENKEKI